MKVAVVGGAGFLGTKLTRRLEPMAACTVYDRDRERLKAGGVYADVEDYSSLSALHGSDIIINLAAEHRDDVRPISRYDDVNVQGAVNVCNAAREAKINKIIFTSSVAVYGFAPPNTDESGEINFFNDYGRTKYLAEEVYRSWFQEDPENRMLVIVRPTVIFGEGNRGNVYNLLKQISDRRFLMIGDGKNKKSMAYVENVAAFIEFTTSFPRGLHIHNYIDKPDFDMNTLVRIAKRELFGTDGVGLRVPSFIGLGIGYLADFVARISHRSLPVSSIRIKKFMGTTQFDSSVATTGFVAPVPLEDALVRTIQYEFKEDNSSNPTFLSE